MSRSATVRCRSLVLGLVTIGLLVGSASGGTIVLDQFDRGSSETAQLLAGSTPTSYDSDWFTSTPTWITSGDWPHSTDGTVLNTQTDSTASAKDSNNANLLFNFQTGYIYTLEADIDVGVGDIWTGIGFLTNANSFVPAGNSSYFWMIQRETTRKATAAWSGPATGGTNSGDVATADCSAHLEIVLDTTLGAASASTPWTVKWYNDEVSNPEGLVHSVSWTTPVDIAGVFLASYGTTTIDNFQLSATAVPEPSTFVLLALAVLGLAVGGIRRWRR